MGRQFEEHKPNSSDASVSSEISGFWETVGSSPLTSAHTARMYETSVAACPRLDRANVRAWGGSSLGQFRASEEEQVAFITMSETAIQSQTDNDNPQGGGALEGHFPPWQSPSPRRGLQVCVALHAIHVRAHDYRKTGPNVGSFAGGAHTCQLLSRSVDAALSSKAFRVKRHAAILHQTHRRDAGVYITTPQFLPGWTRYW